MMILVMKVQKFEFEPAGNFRLPFPVKVEPGRMIGYCPIYETLEDARIDFPDLRDCDYALIQYR